MKYFLPCLLVYLFIYPDLIEIRGEFDFYFYISEAVLVFP